MKGIKEINESKQRHLPLFKRLNRLNEVLSPSNPPFLINRLADIKANLLTKLSEVIEKETGPFYLFNNSALFSPRWSPVINYLEHSGLVKNIILQDALNDEIKLFFFRIFGEFSRKLTDGNRHEEGFARGYSDNYDEALSKAIGEFLERYPLTLYKQRGLLRASVKDLCSSRKAFLSPFDISRVGKEQKEKIPNLSFDENTVFSWTRGKNLLTNKEALIPAQLVFWNYNLFCGNEREPSLRESNTSGAGGYFSLAGALLSGIYENVQRDAFLIHWFNSRPPLIINNDSIHDEEITKLLFLADRYGIDVKFFDTATDIKIPTCVCVLSDKTEKQKFGGIAMGGGCGLNADEALRRSLVEALAVRQWLRYQPNNYVLDKNYKPFLGKEVNQATRLYFWNNPKTCRSFDFFLKGATEDYSSFKKKTKDFSSKEKELSYMTSIFKELGPGYEIYYYQAEHEALKDLNYFSVKVIIPKIIPLYLNEHKAPIASERIYEVPKKLGWKTPSKLNPLPHPFP